MIINPADLKLFTPFGNGVYGYQKGRGSPFLEGPTQEPNGGVIYFGCDVTRKDFAALMRITGVEKARLSLRAFAAYSGESTSPSKDGYLAQLRLVDKFGLHFMFDYLDDKSYESFPEQPMSMADRFWQFIEEERLRWGTSWMQNKGLYGKFGGDGNYACEELGFGFLVENDYHRVYRLWSRAWLVTK